MSDTKNVMFKKGLYSAYAGLTAKDEGTLYFTTDAGRFFLGDDEFGRQMKFGATAPATTVAGTEGDLYLDTTASKLYRYTATAWVAVGTIVGGVTVTGDGNVITAAEVTADGKVKFTKGITAATTGELGTVEANLGAHTANQKNPHKVTAAQVGAYTKAEIDERINGLHTHDNKAELDKIVTGDVKKWNDAAAKAHTHANKAELDKIAAGDKAKWDAKVAGTATGEKVLSVDDSHQIKSTLSLDYDKTSKKIQLKGIGGAVVADLDATAFIKDGMVSNVSFDPGTKHLTITFNTDAGKENIDVDLTSLIDTYTAGQGIDITGSVVSVKIDTASETFLKKTNAGLKLEGVQNAINTAKGEAITAAGTAADQKIAALKLGTMSKETAADYYKKTETYNRTEVDNKITAARLTWGSI